MTLYALWCSLFSCGKGKVSEMKKFSWSKLIAIALSVFIVIQFVEVSFLAAGQIGGARADAGSDASRGSIAGDIYQGVWDKVGDGDMILTAGAAGESTIGVRLLEASAGTLDLSDAGENAFDLSFALSFTPAANAEYLSLGSGKTISIALPEGIQGNFSETAPVSVTRMEAQEAADPGAEPALESVSENRDDIVSAELNDNVLTVTVAPFAYEQLFTAIDDAHVTVSAQLTEAAAGRASATWTYPAGNDAEVTGATVTVVYPAGGSSSTAMAGPEDPVPDPAADPAAGSSEEEDAGTGASSDAGTGATTDAGEGGSAAAGTGGSNEAGTGASDAGTGASDAGTGASDAATAGSSGSTEADTANSGSTAGNELRLVPGTGGTPERTGLSYTDDNITINVTKSTKENYGGADFVSWSATISHKTEKLSGATITLTPGTDQVMYGDAGAVYAQYFDDISSCVNNATDWTMTVKDSYAYTSITIGWMTRPTDAAYWDTHGFLTCSIDVMTAGGAHAEYADVPGVYNKVPSLKIKTVDGNGTALKDCEMMISADRNLFAAAVTGLTMKYYQDASATTPTATGTYARGTWKTAATGTITFTNALVLGAEYELEGIAAPAGYEALIGGLGKFTVDSVSYGDVLDVDLSSADTSIVSFDPVTNTLLIKTDLNVVGSSILAQVAGTGAGIPDVSLAGATFEIWRMKGTSPVPVNDTKIGTATSDAYGLVKFKPAAANAWDSTKDYYLVQTAAPNGYDIYKDAGATIYYTFTVDDDGIVQTRGTEWDNAEGGEAAQGKIVNLRKAGTLVVVRSDIKTDARVKTTDQIKYQIYEDAACTTEVADGEILLTKASGQGISEPAAVLEWTSEGAPKEYYIKETTDTSAMDAGYSVDEKIHGPYSFSTAMTAGKDALSGCAYAVDNANVKITATIIPQKKTPVKFIDPTKSLAGATFMITDDAIKVTTADPTAADVELVTLDATTGEYTASELMTGGSYTLTQTSAPAAGKAKIVVKFTLAADGKVTIKSGTDQATANNTTTPPTVTLKETQPKMVFYMEICTAEDDEEYKNTIDKEKEVAAAPDGFTFSVYDDESCSTLSVNSSGTKMSGQKTDSKGAVTVSGLDDGDYYIKSTQTASVSNATQVQLDKDSDGDYSIFKITQSGGTVTALTKANSGGRWEVKNNKIRAKLKKGSVTIKAQSDKTFYLYRLYAGDSDSDDKREAKKMKGDTATFSSTDKKSYFVTATSSSSGSSKSASLDKMLLQGLKDLDSLFVLKAKAADSASKISYAGQTWQLIGSNQPGNGSSHTFEGLIAGQNYLIREGSEDDSEKKYYLASVTADKDLAITSSTASSGSSSSNASNSKTSGSGTGSGGSSGSAAGGGRGAATGDSNKLWFHLIIMLIAFDALAADLLYISRKKQRA